MHRREGVTVAGIRLAILFVLAGFGFLLWIVAARNPDSLLTQIETLAIAVACGVLLWHARRDDD